MKKFLFLSAMMLLGTTFTSGAEVVADYTESFENASFLPKCWRNLTSSSYTKGSYTVKTTGGHTGGYLAATQYSDYYSSYSENYQYIDQLVTPKVSGTITLWVRKSDASGKDPQLTFYKRTDNTTAPSSYSTNTYLPDGTKNLVEGKDVSDWTKITVENVPADTYIGIRAFNLDIDDFSATSASLDYVTSMTASAKLIGASTLYADADNMVTYNFELTLTNTGDNDIAASEKGFAVKLLNGNLSNKVVGETKVTDALPYGQSVVKQLAIKAKAELAPDTKSNSFKLQISHDGLPTQEPSLGYITLIPYAPVAKFMFNETNSSNQSSYNDVNIVNSIAIGSGAAGTSRSLWMWNSGTARMNVTAVRMEGDFTADATAFTLEPDAKKEIKISLKGDAGFKTGKIVFVETTLGEVSYNLNGVVTKQGRYTENFEAEAIPAGYIADANWIRKATPDALKTLGGEGAMQMKSYSNTGVLISPKMKFDENEAFSFMASKTDNTSSNLLIYTSPDRVTWTKVFEIYSNSSYGPNVFSGDKPTGTGYGTYEYNFFSVPMAAGEMYVKFESKYGVYLDNISGGELVPVAHDLYVVSRDLPNAASVNTRHVSSLRLRNLTAATESGYSLELLLDGNKVAQATETPDLEPNVDQDFQFVFTPHDAGTFKAQYVFVKGEDRLILSEFDMTVDPESASSELQVGTEKITTTEPFNTFSIASQAQVLYSADMLQMQSGSKITAISYHGYNKDKQTKRIRVWMENTEDTEYDPTNIKAQNKANMTLVYDADYEFTPGGDQATKTYVPILNLTLSTPFVYTGHSVRVMTELVTTDPTATEGKHTFYCIDNSKYNFYQDIYDNRCIKKTVDTEEDLLPEENGWMQYRVGYPVTYFSVAKDVVTYKGNVTDELGAPLQGVAVNLSSDDILYKDVTNSDGNYTMHVPNATLTFNFSATAEGYEPVNKADITLDPANTPEVVDNFVMKWIDRTGKLTGKVENRATHAGLAGAEVSLNDKKATTDADGKYEITVDEVTDTYTFKVTMNGQELCSEEFRFPTKAAVKDVQVEYNLVPVIGKVTDEFGAGVKDAEVKLTNGDFVYSDVTDIEGAYTIDVDRMLSYTLTAACDGFQPYEEKDVEVKKIYENLEKSFVMKYTDRTAVLSGKITLKGAPFGGVTVSIAGKTAVTDATGDYSVTVDEFSGEHQFVITDNGTQIYSAPYTFKSKNDTNDVEVENSGIQGIMAEWPANARFFTVDGLEIAEPVSGQVVIVVIANDNGTVTRRRVLVK